MNLSRDVKRDLLTLVEAGEASADTRALVERLLAEDPELARQAAAARGAALPPTPPPPEAGKRALDETRRLLAHRNQTLAVALVFTFLPLAFTFDASGITFLLIRDAPRIGWAWWFTAAVMWGFHLYYRRRLRVSGL
jgi:hypothetical protein